MPATPGSKASTSKRKGAGVRRLQLAQGMMLQGGVAVVLLLMAWLSRRDTRMMFVYLWSLIVPTGTAIVFQRTFRRSEAMREDGTWTLDAERASVKRARTLFALVVVAWLAGVAAFYALM